MRILATVSYKGTNYQGWQKQTNAPSVQEEIEKVLSQILNTPISIYGSGRTDAGVHAEGQRFHFDINKENIDIDRLRYSANCLLPKDIYIKEMKVVDNDFHARFNAKEKVYKYIIRFNDRNPLTYEYEANILNPTSIDLLSDALKEFIGTHNFQDFNSKEEDEKGFVRTINKIDTFYDKYTNQMSIVFYGDGFMRYQIRYMVGTALAIAQGKEDFCYIANHLKENKKREIVNYKAPAEGLYLLEVKY